MPVSGLPGHIDLSVAEPGRSILFYDALLLTLGYARSADPGPDWSGPDPKRATWTIPWPGGAGHFAIEVRPAHSRRRYDRYEPGPHHLALQAADRATVDAVHAALVAIDADILDPPTDYGGQPGYGDAYYAVFVADPDGVKLEVVCTTNVD